MVTMKVPFGLRRQIFMPLGFILFLLIMIFSSGVGSRLGWPENVINDTISSSDVTTDSSIETHAIVLNITDPIAIDGNANFTTTASNSGWVGDGSKDFPYVIEYLNITADPSLPAIDIQNTDVYFIVQYSHFSGGSAGIWLERVKNAVLYNNTISNSKGRGISVDVTGPLDTTNDNINITSNILLENVLGGIHVNVTDVSNIKGNMVVANGLYGLYTAGGDKIIMNNTLFASNHSGLLFENPLNALVKNNTFVFNNIMETGYHEIDFIGTGHNNIIEDNFIRPFTGGGVSFIGTHNSFIQNNIIQFGGTALHLADSDNNTISDNQFRIPRTAINISSNANNTEIYNNAVYVSIDVGIYLGTGVSYSKIHNNTLSQSQKEAIYIVETPGPELRTGNRIYWNDFIESNVDINATSQVFDFHGDNNFTENYWDDEWVGNDSDSNGYIDDPYEVSDPINNTLNDDTKALAMSANPEKQFMWDSDSFLMTPLSPLDVLSGTTVVELPGIFNLWDNFYTYEAYYSGDNGISWSPLVVGVKITSINWNTYGINNGTYILKVVVIDDVTGTRGEWIDPKMYKIANADHLVTPAEFTSVSDNPGVGYEDWTIVIYSDGASSWDKWVSYNFMVSGDNG
ncbi:MAG: right-handed parallel beta-helix repeat-containing protein, partial [Candidatus Kariarchaeaceae archaeon]